MTILLIGYFFTTGTTLYDSEQLKLSLRVIPALIFVLVTIINSRLTDRYIILIICFVLLGLASHSDLVFNIIFLFIISASISSCTIRQIVLIFLIPTIAVIALHLLLYFAGVLNVTTTAYGNRERSALGFQNPNQVSAFYLCLLTFSLQAWLYFRNRLTTLLVLASAFLVYWATQSTDSRTTLFCACILILLSSVIMIPKLAHAGKPIVRAIGILMPIAGLLTTFYLAATKSPYLDYLLSERPYTFRLFIENTSWFDFLVGWRTSEGQGNTVDNAYLMLTSAVGIVVTSLIILYFVKRMLSADIRNVPFLATGFLLGIFEAFLLRPEIPISGFFLYTLIFVDNDALIKQNSRRSSKTVPPDSYYYLQSRR